MSNHLTPLEVCERLIAPVKNLGAIAGLHDKSAYPWRHASAWRDAGDIPSPRIMRTLLKYARKNGIPLTEEHLIEGAKRDEIDDLVQAMRQNKVAAE